MAKAFGPAGTHSSSPRNQHRFSASSRQLVGEMWSLVLDVAKNLSTAPLVFVQHPANSRSLFTASVDDAGGCCGLLVASFRCSGESCACWSDETRGNRTVSPDVNEMDCCSGLILTLT
eukprot:3093575-Rhodomonas_salina.1